MVTSFIPRAFFPTSDSIPRSYYLGHHAAGLAKMRTLLNRVDIVVECRDYRVPLTSRNPMFEDVLKEKNTLVVYTKRDLGKSGVSAIDKARHSLLESKFLGSRPVRYVGSQSRQDVRSVLDHIKEQCLRREALTGSHCMVVGMPNVGKSTLLNALRASGMRKGKVAHTGAQPGVTRSIGSFVKIAEGPSEEYGDIYLLDTPGVFVPYVPDADAMLKLALCGSVKDDVIAPFIVADYLLYHINLNDPTVYSEYHAPTNSIAELLEAMARKTGRLQKGGSTDIDGTAMWMVQRWRNGHLGHFLLDEVTRETVDKYISDSSNQSLSLSQARKADKEAARQRSRARRAVESE